jgi:hypothetical protein
LSSFREAGGPALFFDPHAFPDYKIVISTEDAHAFVSGAVEKSASLSRQANVAHLLLPLAVSAPSKKILSS